MRSARGDRGPKRLRRALHQYLKKEAPDDPDVGRLWLLANLAKEWGTTPFVIAQELDRDPQMLAIVCPPLLRYARFKDGYDSADADRINALRDEDEDLMREVERNDYFIEFGEEAPED